MNDKEKLTLLLDAWKTCVETQQHFNEMLMKVRNFGFVLLAAVISASGLSFKSGYEFNSIPIATAIIACGFLFWLVIYFLEAKWYTPLLHGSVETGMRLEEKIRAIDPDFECMNMGEQIKNFSSNIYLYDNRDRLEGNTLMRGGNKCTFWKIQSELRANLFHWCFLIILLGLAVITFLSGSEDPEVSSSVPQYVGKHSNCQSSVDLTVLSLKER